MGGGNTEKSALVTLPSMDDILSNAQPFATQSVFGYAAGKCAAARALSCPRRTISAFSHAPLSLYTAGYCTGLALKTFGE